MLNSRLALASGGSWSVGHGVIERNPSMALTRPYIDPRDCAAHGIVTYYDQNISAVRYERDADQGAREAAQAGYVRGTQIGLSARGEGSTADADHNGPTS